jgi:hypothetical protein
VSDDAPGGNSPGLLALPKTRLTVEDGELIRRGDGGEVMMRFPLDDIEAVDFVRPFNLFSLIPLSLAGGLVALGIWVSTSNILSVLLYVAAMFLTAFAFFGLRNDTLVLTVRGKEVRTDCSETADDVLGFATSLGGLIGGR